MEKYFKNREEAGERLAALLKKFKSNDAVVVALPRGGVVVGDKVAKILNLPLDLIIVRKIGHLFSPEYAIAAVSESGQMVGNKSELTEVDENWLKKEVEKEKNEANRRRDLYLKGKKRIDLGGKIAIIVDDGMATGLSMLAAILDVRAMKPKKIVVAVPVAPRDVSEKMNEEVDEFIAVMIPSYFFGAVGAYYDSFEQVTDDEVLEILKNVSS